MTKKAGSGTGSESGSGSTSQRHGSGTLLPVILYILLLVGSLFLLTFRMEPSTHPLQGLETCSPPLTAHPST